MSQLIKSVKAVPPTDYYTSGRRTCAGCGPAIGYRLLSKAAGPNTVFLGPTSCMYVANGHQYLTSPYAVPWYHTQLGGGGAAGIGTAAAFRALMSKRKRKNEDINVIVYGGDGGFADIGYSSLSMGMSYDYGRLLFVLNDNESYANTGIQASSTTPWGATTTFTPSGKVKPIGNLRMKKNVALTMAAHPAVKYVATATLHPPLDFMNKVRKALDSGGPSFIEILTPCPKGWFFDPKDTLELAKLALDTRAWVSWEYADGEFSLTYKPRKVTPIKEYLKLQGRFAHLTDKQIEEIQRTTDEEWKYWEEMDKQKRIILPWTSAPNLAVATLT
jgi:pyruvate ferredoxin oxidoreductase beta subunit/oxalate oxidoreductase subunit beta